MKKNYFMSLLACMMAVVMCVGFSSCGSDDDEGSGSYNLTDEEAVSLFQGTWSVNITEYDEEDGDESYTETWVVSGNEVSITHGGSSYANKTVYTINDGVITFGDSYHSYMFNERYRFVKLNSKSFEVNDQVFNNGKMIIRIVGTKK